MKFAPALRLLKPSVALIALVALFVATAPQPAAQRLLANLPGAADDALSVVLRLGDVDGDGVADVALGAPTAAGGLGRVSVVSGADWSELWSVTGPAVGARFGAALASLPDRDGDGRRELAVGAPGHDSVVLLSGASGATLAVVVGPASGADFGHALSTAADHDGDGVPDLLVGAPLDDGAGTDAGAVYVVSSASGALLHAVAGAAPGDHFGFAVAGARSFCHEPEELVGFHEPEELIGYHEPEELVGYHEPEELVGAPHGGANGGGYVKVFSTSGFVPLATLEGDAPGDGFGSALAHVGDVDGDGSCDALIGAPGADRAVVINGLTRAAIFTLSSPVTGTSFGHAVAGVGDVNGDGIPDLAVGAPQCATGGTSAGRLTVYSGSQGRTLLALVGSDAGQALGTALVGLGDIDGDGLAELAVAEPFALDGDGRVTVLGLSLWNTLENGLPGLTGVPRLAGEGGVDSQQSALLELEDGRPVTAATLIIGTMLVLDSASGELVPLPEIVVNGLMTSGDGSLTCHFELPEQIPSGTVIYQQFLLVDATAPGGISRSNTVAATVP